MKKLIAVLSLTLATLASAQTTDSPPLLEKAESKLKATFQNFQFLSMKESEVPGLIEIYTGKDIIYYSPEAEMLIFGQFYSAKGVPVTERNKRNYRAAMAGAVDTSSALTVGEGDRELVFFTNPECGYCKLAIQWLAQNPIEGVKLKVMFMVDKSNVIGYAKAATAVCAEDTMKGLLEAHSAALPGKEPAQCEGLAETLASHAAQAEEVGAFATPYFIYGGEAWAGFQSDRLAALQN